MKILGKLALAAMLIATSFSVAPPARAQTATPPAESRSSISVSPGFFVAYSLWREHYNDVAFVHAVVGESDTHALETISARVDEDRVNAMFAPQTATEFNRAQAILAIFDASLSADGGHVATALTRNSPSLDDAWKRAGGPLASRPTLITYLQRYFPALEREASVLTPGGTEGGPDGAADCKCVWIHAEVVQPAASTAIPPEEDLGGSGSYVGAAMSGYFNLANAGSGKRSGNLEYTFVNGGNGLAGRATLMSKLHCAQLINGEERECESGCKAVMHAHGDWGGYAWVKAEKAGGIGSKSAKAMTMVAGKARFLAAGQAFEPFAAKAVMVVRSFNSTVNWQAIVSLVGAWTGAAIAEHKDDDGSNFNQVDAKLLTTTATNLIGIVKREGEQGKHGQPARVTQSATSPAFAPEQTLAAQIESGMNTEAERKRGYADNSFNTAYGILAIFEAKCPYEELNGVKIIKPKKLVSWSFGSGYSAIPLSELRTNAQTFAIFNLNNQNFTLGPGSTGFVEVQ